MGDEASSMSLMGQLDCVAKLGHLLETPPHGSCCHAAPFAGPICVACAHIHTRRPSPDCCEDAVHIAPGAGVRVPSMMSTGIRVCLPNIR